MGEDRNSVAEDVDKKIIEETETKTVLSLNSESSVHYLYSLLYKTDIFFSSGQ